MEIIEDQLAAGLLDTYEDLDLGERIDETTIRAFEGGTELSLASTTNKELIVYVDGTSVDVISYDDPRLSDRLLLHASAALGF